MQLGKQTGSVTNWIYSIGTKGQPAPEIGMGATVLHWTDRSPATIVRVFEIYGLPAIEIQGDKYERTDSNGFSESQTYEYTPNPTGAKSTWRFRNNKWEQVKINPDTKRWKCADGGGLRIGEREAYWDPCF
jgi:hypothetical protein